MSCVICSLTNVALQNDIERLLDANHGVVPEDQKKALKEKYPEDAQLICSISDQEFLMHWNFHQVSSYVPAQVKETAEGEKSKSLRDDIGKDEASVIHDLMSKQMETFNRLSRKINAAIDDEDSNVSHAIINPVTMEFYNRLTSSIRANVKELRELNDTVNGKSNGSLEGLKAIALAISQPLDSYKKDGEADDMSTEKFDY